MAYAAAAGTIAAEGPAGGNSPYTGTVLETLSDPSVSLYEGLFRAHEKVRARSATQQRPYLSTDMNGEVFLQRQPTSRVRRAIIVANDMFIERGQLSNVHNDARDWFAFLRDKCGFEARQLKNPKKAELLSALSELIDGSRRGSLHGADIHRAGVRLGPPPNTLIMLIYAGFGLTIDGDGYINTDDADHRNEKDLGNTMISLAAISEMFREKTAASIMILDTNFPTLDFMKQNGWWPTQKQPL